MMENNQRNPTLGERLDSLIGLFSPRKALDRKAARMMLKAAAAYENVPAWRGDAGWIPVDGYGEAINQFSRDIARAKARHLERNSDVVGSILEAWTSNVVGDGFNLQARTPDQDWNNLLEDIWAEWCMPGNCDVTGTMSFLDILQMVVLRKQVDGGIIVVKSIRQKDTYPYKLQLVEVSELDGISTVSSAINTICGGIEIDAAGKPIAYYLKRYNFNETIPIEPIRYPADRIFFLRRRSRPSELREMTPLVKSMGTIRDLDEFFKAAVFKQKIAAAMAVFITSPTTGGPIPGNSLVRGAGNSDPKAGMKGERIDPGSIKYLAPGQDAKMLVPSGQSSELADYNLIAMRRIAAGSGLSYEMVSRDVSQVNYSSARQNLLEDWKKIRQEQRFLIDHFLDFVFTDVIKYAILSGKIPAKKVPPDFWENSGQYLKHEFIGQGLPWIDPYKEAMADKVLLETKQTSLKDLYAKKGRDYLHYDFSSVKQALRIFLFLPGTAAYFRNLN